ncbi:MAG TPA: PH domain-containing protein [Candidatus Nanopelagicales bacterium]|nr:PH domain-containing protein [Candidatus Nanopelagicales bacterium]
MAAADVNEAFAPAGEPWIRISPKLATAYRVNLVFWVVVAAIALVVLAKVVTIDPTTPGWVPKLFLSLVVVDLVVLVWIWWLIGRRVRSWGYAERTDDLLVTSGILFRRLVIVPYGRMQLVDLKAGPVHRALGIMTVQLHTAAATTDASIPGLAPEVAADLRDRLAARGEQRSAGL